MGVRLILEVCGCFLGRARYELGFACLELKAPRSTKTETVLPTAKIN